MTCASCQHHVEEALRATAGVESGARGSDGASRERGVQSCGGSAGAIGGGDSRSGLRRGAAARGRRRSARRTWLRRLAARPEGVGDAGGGRGSDAAGHAAETRDGRARFFSWLAYFRGSTIPADGLRWFLLALTAAVVAWAGRGIYCERVARCGTAQPT
jgi:hypothetical protein